VKGDRLTRFLVPAELSATLTIPESTLAKWRYEGTGPAYIRVGKHVRYPAEEVERWITERFATSQPQRA